MDEDTAALRVLVVDDHRDTAVILARVIGGGGHRVRTAHDFDAAVAAAAAGPVDLLLADLTLPDGDGCHLLSAVRAHRPACRGAVVTGAGDHDEADRCRRAGYDWFLVKPVGIDAVLAVVADAARGRTAVTDP